VRACRGQLLFYYNHIYWVTVIVYDGWMITWRLHDALYEISDGDRISGTTLNFCSDNLSYDVGAVSEQTQRGFLSVKFDVLQDKYRMVDWPFMFTRSNVQSVVQDKGLLSFFWDSLIYYGNKFLDIRLVWSHICIKQPRADWFWLWLQSIFYYIFHSAHFILTCSGTHNPEELFREMFSQGTDDESEVVPEPIEQPLMVLSSSAWSGTATATTWHFQDQIQHQDILVLIDSGSSHTFLINSRLKQLFMSVYYSAWSGTTCHQTLKLKGRIQEQSLNILLDSGSTHTFVSDKLIPLLSGVQSISYSTKVQVANGPIVSGRYQWLQAHWQIQEYEFVSDLLFLPLPSSDMAVDMDWAQKWLAIL
jgi:hypothetical protein